MLNEFDDDIINRLSCAVEDDVIYYDKDSKIYRIVEYCLSNDTKKGKELKELLFNLLEKYTKLLEEINLKKEKLISTSNVELEVFVKSYWKPYN